VGRVRFSASMSGGRALHWHFAGYGPVAPCHTFSAVPFVQCFLSYYDE